MNLPAEKRRRLLELANEIQEIVGGWQHSDGRAMTFSELEDECIEVGDLLTAAILEGRVSERPVEERACCPSCHREACLSEEMEPRVLQTDRGEVCWNEPSYYCRHCRRSFFPSVR